MEIIKMSSPWKIFNLPKNPQIDFEIKALEFTIRKLAAYHAEPLYNPQFRKRYRHLIKMYYNICEIYRHIPDAKILEKYKEK